MQIKDILISKRSNVAGFLLKLSQIGITCLKIGNECSLLVLKKESFLKTNLVLGGGGGRGGGAGIGNYFREMEKETI